MSAADAGASERETAVRRRNRITARLLLGFGLGLFAMTLVYMLFLR